MLSRASTSKRRKLSPPTSDSEDIGLENKNLQDQINAMLGAGGPSMDSGDDEEELGESGEEEEEEEFDQDSETNEFEQQVEFEDDDMIDDDGVDLMANLDEAEDDSESDEFSDLEAAAPAPLVLKKANVRNSKGVAPLKPAELRALAFAELTASPISNTISTSVSNFLTPITPPSPATSPLQIILKELHSHITELPSRKPSTLSQLKKKSKVNVPGEFDPKWSKIELNWEKPRKEDVRIVGSWAWGGAIKEQSGEYIVDLAIGLPQTLLQVKDYLSPRFQTKSSHYLLTLASHLPTSLGPISLSYIDLPGSQGLALEVRSAHQKGTEKVGLAKAKGAVLRLRCVWTGIGLDTFLPAKLGPTKNLIRPIAPEDSLEFPSTPIHASSLHLSSLPLLTNHLKHFHIVSTTHPAFSSTVRLLQSWAVRRNFGISLGLTSEFWGWCVARTLDWGAGSSASAGGSGSGGEAWAGWRKAVEWLAGMNWTDGIFFRVEGEDSYSKEDFKTAFKGRPIFIDPTGKVNLAAGIDLATLDMLKQDAKTTIALLLSANTDEIKFAGSFASEIRVTERFDNFARITVPKSSLTQSNHLDALDFGSPLEYFMSSISSTLQRALGTRARAFQLSIINSSPLTLSLGLVLDSAEAGRLVDQGPSAENEGACNEFKAFWGEKSELRRFKDGAILESVVWDEIAPGGFGQQRNKVVKQIVQYILNSRHGISTDQIEIFAGSLDHLIVEPEMLRKAIYLEDSVANNKGFGNIMGVYDELTKELTGLTDLPLAISSIAPSSPGLRYSTIFTPSPRRLKDFGRFPDSTKFIEIHDIIITLEGSGRWPEDLEGIQKIKAAFLAKIGEKLSILPSIYRTEVVFDLEVRPIDDNVSLEILTATGFAFRARMNYERSLLLLEAREKKMGNIIANSVESSLEVYKSRFLHAPKHHAALATLQHHFTSYSPTIRLVKRWFSSHLLSNHFPDELIELLVASIFIDSTSIYEVPNSGAAGFARTMAKLSDWAWKDEPLLIPLYTFSTATTSGRRAAFPPIQKEVIQAAFELRRLSDPSINLGGAWFFATEEDLQGKVWGRNVGKVAAGRVKGLARATLNALEEGVRNGNLINETLFSPPLSDYSFVIHLHPTVVPRHFQALVPTLGALTLSSKSRSVLSGSLAGEFNEDSPRLGWDPVSSFVKDLEALYPSVYLLFASSTGSSTIGGIWNPLSEGTKPWSVGIGYPVKPVINKSTETGKAKVELDKVAVLQEIERLGKGLIASIE